MQMNVSVQQDGTLHFCHPFRGVQSIDLWENNLLASFVENTFSISTNPIRCCFVDEELEREADHECIKCIERAGVESKSLRVVGL